MKTAGRKVSIRVTFSKCFGKIYNPLDKVSDIRFCNGI